MAQGKKIVHLVARDAFMQNHSMAEKNLDFGQKAEFLGTFGAEGQELSIEPYLWNAMFPRETPV